MFQSLLLVLIKGCELLYKNGWRWVKKRRIQYKKQGSVSFFHCSEYKAVIAISLHLATLELIEILIYLCLFPVLVTIPVQ